LEFLSEAASDVRGHGNATAAAWVLGRHAEEAAAAGDGIGALRAALVQRKQYAAYQLRDRRRRMRTPSAM
jgi:hypothetical protein